MKLRKKLIEVALPLPEINDASAYDKMPGIGPHPKGIHQWWARLPLPTARAVLFASVVDDPSAHPEQFSTEESQNAERERLFGLVRRMMGKKLHEHPEVYAAAHKEMLKYCDGNLPAVFDPFCGGGSIPLEANRLGFATHAGDLNPVAVLLNKCNLEIAPQWIGQPPANPDSRRRIGGTDVAMGTGGLAADIRYYSKLIRRRAAAKIGDLYPRLRLPDEYGGGKADVIAWIWARTVRTPNPAFPQTDVPLASSFVLSTKPGREAYIALTVNGQDYSFTINSTESKHSKAGTKLARGSFRCILSDVPIRYEYIDDEANAGRMGARLMAVVADGPRGRVYLPPTESMEAVARAAKPDWIPDAPCRGTWASNAQGRLYGFHRFADYFTLRQLTALATFSSLVLEVSKDIQRDAIAAGLSNESAHAYSTAVVTFLALALDRCADFNNSLCRWSPSNEKVMNLFGRQAIPMVWDFAEANISADSVGGWSTCSDYVADCVEVLGAGSATGGCAHQLDAAALTKQISDRLLVSTDPPYYDNISYASLSDFFYVWLRHTLGGLHPDLFSTVLVPKAPELTASAERFDGDKAEAKKHFEIGFRNAFTALRDRMDRRFPLTVYYAFKQDDESAPEEVGKLEPKVDLTTGWETLLEALVGSGFQITGTWPVRASQKWRMVSMGTNSLASYIVLACRPRPTDAPQTDRRSFVAELKQTLPSALRHLQQANIAPVDFAQAAIGPGMAIFSKYTRILESTGKTMAVRAALSLINQSLTEVLSELEDDFDGDTRWAIAWFEQQGFSDGDFGQAELLSKAKVTSVTGLQHAGIISSHAGKVRLIRPNDLSKDWNPATDRHLTVWEMTHHLLRVYYYEEGGDAPAAALLNRIGARGEIARELAYRLFDICEKKKRSQEAQGYNALVLGWPEIARFARESRSALPAPKQTELYRQE